MLRRLFPCMLIACFALCLSATANAQISETRSRQAAAGDTTSVQRLENEPAVSVPAEERPALRLGAKPARNDFEQLLLTAIEDRLGASYHYGGTGPNRFDCSGFVWRTFQEAGLSFTRGPARSYWATMPAATAEERTKFGTLVFFSGLAHVGIVADEKGFYHASRHHGVIYSPFNDYWLARIDGFRRVPLSELKLPTLNEKVTTSKSVQSSVSVVAGNGSNH